MHGALNTLLAAAQVLPRVVEQIVSCKDNIAQQYLMQCVIQVGVGSGGDRGVAWGRESRGK